MKSRVLMYAGVVALLGLASGAREVPSRNPDASYAVYNAVIRAMAADAIQLHSRIGGRPVAIGNRTIRDELGDGATVRKRLVNAFKTLGPTTIADYLRVRELRRPLERAFDIPLPYELVRDDGSPPFDVAQVEAGGFIRLSRVGFSRDRREAVVYVVHICGGLCATGHFVSLRFGPGGWRVEHSTLMIIS
jgi:hypothetical protein